MGEEGKPAANPLIQAFAPLHRSAMGTAVGIVLGTMIFLATLASMGRDPYSAGHLGLLSQFFVGYSVSLRGALIGLVWGFVTGYVVGWAFALLRNVAVWIYLIGLRSRADMEQYSDFLDHL
jgi:ABC-type dipeptide/oligopeptide/nickel transport system permease subunit